MIRLRSLRPREVRSIRHWAIELAVVVVGVLLALWAAEWAEGRRDLQRMALAERDMREELRLNFAALAIHRSFDRCKREQIARIYGDLLASEDRWPGINEDVVLRNQPDDIVIPGFYSLPASEFLWQAYDAALSTNLLNEMDRDRLALYRAAYHRFKVGQRFLEEENSARTRLSGLVPPGSMTAQVRTEAMGSLQRLEASRVALIQVSDAVEIAKQLDLGSSPQMEEELQGFRDVIAVEGLKPCVADPVNLLSVPE